MTAFVTANQVGTGTLTATQLTGPPLTPNSATATVIAQQIASQIGVTPDTLSTGMGDTVAFHAAAADSGGTVLATQPAFQWEVDSIFRAGLVKLDSAADSLQIRFDSGVYNFPTFDWVSVARPFIVRTAGDTIFGQGTLHNPLRYNVVGSGISIGSASRAVVDTTTNKTFYTSGGNNTVYVNDNTVNGIVAGISGAINPSWLAVSHAGGADKVYVSNSSGGAVSVIDPATNLVSTTIPLPLTSNPFGITAADPLGRVYVAARYCPGFPGLCTTEVAILPIDVAGDSVVTADIVPLNTDSLRFPQGLAFNPNDHRLYIAMDSGYVKVVDPVAKTEVGTIMVQPGFTLSDVAVNPLTDTVYVSNFGGGGIAVIDPTTATVVNQLPANTPTGIGVDPLHNRIYYASSGNQSVIEIDGANENFHTMLVGAGGDNPQDAQPDPRTGTVYAPHFSALTALQFYGKPVGALLGAPPFRGAAPAFKAATGAPKRLAPMTPRPVAPKPRPAKLPVRVTTGTSAPKPILKAPKTP
jgi:YVTN family beta-propeller protein